MRRFMSVLIVTGRGERYLSGPLGVSPFHSPFVFCPQNAQTSKSNPSSSCRHILQQSEGTTAPTGASEKRQYRTSKLSSGGANKTDENESASI